MKAHVDKTALRQLPDNYRHLYPIVVNGDGNCLARVGSVLAYGMEASHADIRLRLAVEMIENKDYYLKTENISKGIEYVLTADQLIDTFNKIMDGVEKCYQ